MSRTVNGVFLAACAAFAQQARTSGQVTELRCPVAEVAFIDPDTGPPQPGRQIFISGRVAVRSVFGAPVAGATITLRRSGVATGTVTTDTNGAFSFPFVPLGDYEMQIQARRFRPQTIRLSGTSPDKGYVGTIALAAN